MKKFEIGKVYAIENADQLGPSSTIVVEARTARFLTYTYCGLTFKSAIRTDGDCEYVRVAKSKYVECKADTEQTAPEAEAATETVPAEVQMTDEAAIALIGQRAGELAKLPGVKEKAREIYEREGAGVMQNYVYLLAIATLCGTTPVEPADEAEAEAVTETADVPEAETPAATEVEPVEGKAFEAEKTYQNGNRYISVSRRTGSVVTYCYKTWRGAKTCKAAVQKDFDGNEFFLHDDGRVFYALPREDGASSPAVTQEAEAVSEAEPEWDYDYLSGRYAIFGLCANGTLSNEFETDDLKEAMEYLKEEWDGSLEAGAFAIFDRDARQYIQIRATPKGRKAFKKENERLAQRAKAVSETEAPAKAAAMTAQEATARKMIAEQTTEYLLNTWEGTTTNNDPFIPTVRGWLMAELRGRYPEAYDKWLDSETCEDAALREYINAAIQAEQDAAKAPQEAGETTDAQAPDADDVRERKRKPEAGSAAAGQPAPQADMTDAERLDALFHELVPAEGKADTVAGEIVRAVCRIGYRYNNDGDYVGCGYGKETCNPAARYLMANAGENVAEIVRCLWAAGEECDWSYEDWLSELVKATLAHLEANPELKTTPNAVDMWEYRDPEEDVDDEEDEDADEWDAA